MRFAIEWGFVLLRVLQRVGVPDDPAGRVPGGAIERRRDLFWAPIARHGRCLPRCELPSGGACGFCGCILLFAGSTLWICTGPLRFCSTSLVVSRQLRKDQFGEL